jgi:drug/metabolite transporter (DMT)-like permease
LSFSILLLIALSSLCWSLSDMSRKKLAGNVDPVVVVIWLMLLQAPLFAMFLFREQWSLPGGAYWLPAFGSIVMNAVANVLFIESVALAPLSMAIPVLALAPVFSVLSGWLLLSETTTLRQMIGITVVVCAIFMLGRVGIGKDSSLDPKKVRKGMWIMAFVGFLFAVAPTLDKICLRMAPSSEHAFLQCVAIAALLIGWQFARRLKGSVKDLVPNRKWFLMATTFATIALLTQLWAIQGAPMGLFESLKRSIGLLLSLIFGFIFFGEAIRPIKAALVVVMGIGLFILLA